MGINTENLDIRPEPGSKKEMKDPSLRGIVFERETKKMAGAIESIKNLMEKKNTDSDSDKSAENEQNKSEKSDETENRKNE